MARLAVTKLILSHFRSHRRNDLYVEKKMIAVWGPNGAGKTNILEAVSLLSPGRGLRGAAAGDFTRQPENIGWKLTSTLDTPSGVHEVVTSGEPEGSRKVMIDGKPAPQVALGRIARVLWLTPAMDRLWSGGAEGRRRFLDRITLSFDPDHAGRALDYEKALRERNRLLKTGEGDAGWFAALEARLAQTGADIHRARSDALALIAAAQDDAKSSFPAADLFLAAGTEDTDPGDADALREALARGRRLDERAGRTLIGAHRADLQAVYRAKGAAADQCSTGEQKALLLSIVLANARALSKAEGAPPILLLDEVAAHLDADRRAALYTEIRALRSQAWMTGTERALFDSIPGGFEDLEVHDDEGMSRVNN